jgi:hypothetical protein
MLRSSSPVLNYIFFYFYVFSFFFSHILFISALHNSFVLFNLTSCLSFFSTYINESACL